MEEWFFKILILFIYLFIYLCMAFYDVLSISDWVLIILCGWVGGRRGIYDFLFGWNWTGSRIASGLGVEGGFVILISSMYLRFKL